MELTSVISQAYRKSNQKQQDLHLKQGQIIYGKVVKEENGKAFVQIGSHFLKASVETFVQENKNYWFRVFQQEDTIQLKVMKQAQQLVEGNPNHLEGMLKEWGMKATKENQMILSFFMKEGMSISKELFEQVRALLSNVTSLQEGLTTIKLMIARGLPMKEPFFSILMQAQSKQQFLTDFSQFLQKAETLPLQPDTKRRIEQLQQKITVDGMEFLKTGAVTDEKSSKALLFLVKEAYVSDNKEAKRMMELLLPKVSITQQEIQQVLQSKVPMEALQVLLAKKNAPVTVPQLLERLQQSINESNETMQQMAKIIEKAPVQELAKTLKSIVPFLGLQYEKDMVTFMANREWMPKEQLLAQTKAILLEMRNQWKESSEGFQQVNELLNRHTALQLVNVQNQPLFQLLFHFPISFTKHIEEAIVQFEGKKNKNNEINPDFCRIVFYLQLEHVKETIVDVQIQNKIVSIHLYNEHSLEKQVRILTPMLKMALEDLDYQLSFVKSIEKNEPEQKPLLETISDATYQEVDIRI
ncbi:hypothetical protein [Massilibacterium senegalense]|uniref:hypothetical protein n=1 Tax=Massilibacterium senegalense TaxID=1632858 RepID=UPI000784C96F|nr:hypothetical protein [Massilibacterium senegalense]